MGVGTGAVRALPGRRGGQMSGSRRPTAWIGTCLAKRGFHPEAGGGKGAVARGCGEEEVEEERGAHRERGGSGTEDRGRRRRN